MAPVTFSIATWPLALHQAASAAPQPHAANAAPTTHTPTSPHDQPDLAPVLARAFGMAALPGLGVLSGLAVGSHWACTPPSLATGPSAPFTYSLCMAGSVALGGICGRLASQALEPFPEPRIDMLDATLFGLAAGFGEAAALGLEMAGGSMVLRPNTLARMRVEAAKVNHRMNRAYPGPTFRIYAKAEDITPKVAGKIQKPMSLLGGYVQASIHWINQLMAFKASTQGAKP